MHEMIDSFDFHSESGDEQAEVPPTNKTLAYQIILTK